VTRRVSRLSGVTYGGTLDTFLKGYIPWVYTLTLQSSFESFRTPDRRKPPFGTSSHLPDHSRIQSADISPPTSLTLQGLPMRKSLAEPAARGRTGRGVSGMRASCLLRMRPFVNHNEAAEVVEARLTKPYRSSVGVSLARCSWHTLS